MRSIGRLFLLLLTNLTASGQASTLPDSLYNIQDSVLIPTRNGHFISSIIIRRKENRQALPVVLFYTTYYQGAGDSFFGKISADKDYVGVVAYSRGIRANINDYFPYEHDGADVYDVIDWISNNHGATGK
jgi:predicted acyl esterase